MDKFLLGDLADKIKIYKLFLKIEKNNDIENLKSFMNDYYSLNEEMPIEFYELLLNKINSNDMLLLYKVILRRNIFLLISYLKYNLEDVDDLDNEITPIQYYCISKKHINNIVSMLKKLELRNNCDSLGLMLEKELIWLLKKNPRFTDNEYKIIAYKIYLSIGLDNGIELLSYKYGIVDYEKIYFLFYNINTNNKISDIEYDAFNKFLFNNKKEFNNVMRLMFAGKFKELFLNFDYFYNNIGYFISKLGIKLPRDKVRILLGESYLPESVILPQISGDILDDMISSYYCKYDFLDTSYETIKSKNFEIYNEYLRNRYKSSIPQIELENKGNYICEILNLNDPKNLVLGYRAGNCFRINGEASLLFNNFLKNEHMRLLSISTLEYKDFAMMLVMRNGNVLIGQGIETSKRIPETLKGKKLYDVCRDALREIMNYMNDNDDEIVATIIGSSNENVSDYNKQILPFLINPILDNNNSYYNGIYNYQCLMDLKEGSSLNNIKLYVPMNRYLDKRESILRRYKWEYDLNYRKIEQKLISLRYMRMKKENSIEFYNTLSYHNELYTCCSNEFYITLFTDGTIDSFIMDSEDERVKDEYEMELAFIQQKALEINSNRCLSLKRIKK